MIKLSSIFAPMLLTGLVTAYAPMSQAEGMQQNYGYSQSQVQSGNFQLQNYTNTVNPSYGSEIGAKAANGLTNIVTSPLEIPKNIINTTNQSNVFYGIIGGIFKGLVHTAGRMASGLTDFVFFPLPTKPIAHPLYVWNDFDRDTTYGDIFSMQEKQAIPESVAQTPPPPAPAEAAPPQTSVSESPPPYSQDTNQKLDTLFKEKMMK